MDSAQREMYEIELRRLDAEAEELKRSWSRVPWFAVCFLSAPILGSLYGVGVGVVAFLISGALCGMRTYLVGIRVSENRWTRQSLARDLAEGTRAPEPSGNASLGRVEQTSVTRQELGPRTLCGQQHETP